jgi:hypothetical protein
MATKKEQLEVGIVATDKASKVIKEVAGGVEALDGETASVDLTADDQATDEIKDVADRAEALDKQTVDVELTADDKATADIQALETRIAGLTDADKKVILTAESSKLKREVDNATVLLGRVDGETFTAVLDARNDAQRKLEAVDAALDTLDRRSVDATLDTDDRASGDISRLDGKLDELDRRTTDTTIDAHEGAGFSGVMGRVEGMPGIVGGIGPTVAGMVGRGGAVGILAATMAGVASSASDTAIEVDNLAGFTGTSLDQASRLYAVFKDNHVEVDELVDLLGQMSGVIADNPKLITDMGISMDTVREGPVAVLIEVMEKFWADGKLSDSERVIAMQLFGEEGVRQVNAIAGAVGGDLQGAMDDVSEIRIFDEDDITKARQFNTSMTEAMASIKTIALGVGGPTLELLNPVMKLLALIADQIPKAYDVLTLDAGSLGLSDFSDEFDDFVRLVQSGREQAEAWDLAFGSMDGFDRMQQMVADAVAMIGRGTPVVQAMGEVFGVDEDNALGLAEALGVIDGATGDVIAVTDDSAEAQRRHQEAIDNVNAAIDTQVATLDEEIEKLGEEVDALEDARDAQLDMIDAKREATDSEYAARDAQDDFTSSLDKYVDMVDHDWKYSEEEIAEALDGTREAAVDAADAEQDRANAIAKANGITLTATEGVDNWNDSIVRSARQAEGPARQAILDYAFSYNEIPTEYRTAIEAAIEAGDLAEAERLLDEASAPRRAAVRADANQASIDAANNAINTTTKTRYAVVNAQANVAQAQRDIDWLARNRNATIYVGRGIRASPAAQGSPSANRGAYLVGEQGPELVQMRGGERINTADQTKNILDRPVGPNVVNNITVNQPAGVTARDTAAAIRRYERIQGTTAAA